jgi:hypothetical protein
MPKYWHPGVSNCHVFASGSSVAAADGCSDRPIFGVGRVTWMAGLTVQLARDLDRAATEPVGVSPVALGRGLGLDARCGPVDSCRKGRRNQHRPAKRGGDDMNMLWIGVLAGMIVCAGPEWLKILTFVVAVLFSGLLVHLPVHGHGHPHATANPWVLAIGGVGFGVWSWHYARKRGLQHLGAAELNTRWTNVRKMSKWGW